MSNPGNLIDLLEKEHQTLLDKIDSLDQKISEVLKEWTGLPEESKGGLERGSEGEEGGETGKRNDEGTVESVGRGSTGTP